MTERTDKTLSRLTNEVNIVESKLKQIKAKKTKIQNRQKSVLATAERKLQTRRKILLGAHLIRWMEQDNDIKNKVLEDLEKYLDKPHDRKVFDMPLIESTQNEG